MKFLCRPNVSVGWWGVALLWWSTTSIHPEVDVLCMHIVKDDDRWRPGAKMFSLRSCKNTYTHHLPSSSSSSKLALFVKYWGGRQPTPYGAARQYNATAVKPMKPEQWLLLLNLNGAVWSTDRLDPKTKELNSTLLPSMIPSYLRESLLVCWWLANMTWQNHMCIWGLELKLTLHIKYYQKQWCQIHFLLPGITVIVSKILGCPRKYTKTYVVKGFLFVLSRLKHKHRICHLPVQTSY